MTATRTARQRLVAPTSAEVRTAAEQMLNLVLNGEASWTFAYAWLERIERTNAADARQIRAEWRAF